MVCKVYICVVYFSHFISELDALIDVQLHGDTIIPTYLQAPIRSILMRISREVHHVHNIISFIAVDCTILKNMCSSLSSKIGLLCGALSISAATGQAHTYKWQFNPLSSYAIIMTFRKFSMLYSVRCSINHLIIGIKLNRYYEEYLCGDLAPWNTSYSGSHFHLNLHINWIQDIVLLDVFIKLM